MLYYLANPIQRRVNSIEPVSSGDLILLACMTEGVYVVLTPTSATAKHFHSW